MTIDEIDRLEAGRDADALVAQVIPLPGVRLERVSWEPETPQPYWRYTEAGFRERFCPTTDPAAAAIVLEWLRDFGRPDIDDAAWEDFSELAICKAALRAIASDLSVPEIQVRTFAVEVRDMINHVA